MMVLLASKRPIERLTKAAVPLAAVERDGTGGIARSLDRDLQCWSWSGLRAKTGSRFSLTRSSG
jgi:hypothetical protein